jgi:hypothetical protein
MLGDIEGYSDFSVFITQDLSIVTTVSQAFPLASLLSAGNEDNGRTIINLFLIKALLDKPNSECL